MIYTVQEINHEQQKDKNKTNESEHECVKWEVTVCDAAGRGIEVIKMSRVIWMDLGINLKKIHWKAWAAILEGKYICKWMCTTGVCYCCE